jgi:hypothetical protein
MTEGGDRMASPCQPRQAGYHSQGEAATPAKAGGGATNIRANPKEALI